MNADDDEPIDVDEMNEAAALARALDRGHADEALPHDALQTAAFIRYSRDSGVLSDERREMLLGAVLEAGERAADRRSSRRSAPIWRWLFAGVALSIAVLVVFIVSGRRELTPTALPAPSRSLLRAQMERTSGDDDTFEREMRTYRGHVYASLTARYGAR